jgi:hypothetical protein
MRENLKGFMYFAFKWKHQDGAMVEFAPEGWYSDDPAKTEWLNTESERSGCWPIVPPTIRFWLQHKCELLEFKGVVLDYCD